MPSPSLDAWHGSLGGRVHLSPCVSLHLSPVVSPPGCLARLSGWTGSFVSLCLPSFVSRCLPAWMPGTALWVDGFICLPVSPLICLPLSPRLDAWHGSLGGRVHLSPCVSLHLSPVVSPPGCLARLSGWTGSFVCLPLSPRLDAWHSSLGDGFICLPVSPFICLPLSPRLDAWHGSLGGRVHFLPVSPFICLPLSPRLDAWHGSLGGRVHLSPCVSLHLSPVVSPPGCLARLSGWTGSFVSLCLPSFVSRCLPAWMPGTALWVDEVHLSPCVSLHLSPVVSPPGCLARLSGWTGSFVSLCLPSFVSRCLPAWVPGTALWVDGFICLPVSPFICLPLSPRLDAWHGSLGGRVHLSPCVSLHLSPVVSPPGCLARLSGWTGSFVSLCLPSFVSHSSLGGRVHLSSCVSLHLSPVVSPPGCLALWVDGFICLPVSPFICLPLSPRLDAWHGSLGGRVHLSPCVSLHLSPVVSPPGCLARLSGWTGSFVSLCLPSFVSRCLPAWMPGTALWVDGFICLPVSPFICLPLSPRLDAWHGSLGGRVHLSPCVSLHLSPVVSPPDAWHGSLGGRVHLSPCVSLHLSPVVPPAWIPGTALWVDGFICLPVSPFICLPLSPRLDAWHGSLGGRVHLSPCVSLHFSPVVSPPGCLARLSGWTGSFVFLCLPSFVSRCLPAWMPGTALWVDGFICLPVSPFICLPLSPRLDAWHGFLGGRVHLSPCVSLHLSPVVSPPGCLARLSGWTGSFVSLCLPSFVSRCPPRLDPWHGSLGGRVHLSPCVSLHLSPVVSPMPGTALWVDGFICLPVSPFIFLPLSPRLDAWHGSLGGRVHLSPCVSLHLSPVVSPPGCLARLSGWTRFICLPVSPFICLPLSPRLDAWHGSLGGRVHLSPCVSLHLSPVVSPPGCLARLSGWTGSFVSLCLPSFVSRCLPAWMPGTALWVDGFICLPVSPFICLPLSPRLDAWHGSLGGRVHLSPCVSLHLSPTALWVDGFICLPVSPFICLPLSPRLDVWLSGWTGSFVSLCLPSFVSRCLPAWMPGTALWVDGFICLPVSPFICLPLSPRLDAWHGSLGGRVHLSPCVSLHLSPVVSPPGCLARLSGWTGSFVSLCLPSFVSRCLPAWMPGTALWVDGIICLPVSPFICLPLSPRRPWLRSFLVLWMLGTGSSSVCPSSGFRFRLGSWWVVFLVYHWLRPVCSFSARYQLRPLSGLARIWSPELTRAVRCGARLQPREGSVNPPVKQT